MVDLTYLKSLVELAKSQGLVSFKMGQIEFTIGQDLKEIAAQVKAEESKLPPDLRADDLMNHDKVLHWSSEGPDDPMPLTGEGYV